MELSADQITALAPDEGSIKAAKGLLAPTKWPTLGHSGSAAWGECQGSGSKPYQVQVDFNGPAFRCSCPSRKFPCKHGLALLLLRAQNPAAFLASAHPPWVEEWLATRAARQERAEKEPAKKVADPEAAARQEAKRLEKMQAGARELSLWLADRVRHGLGELDGQHAAFESMAARMVDAQAPGLAARMRQMRDIVGSGPAWHVRLLASMGQMQLLLDALHNVGTLPLPLRAEVLATVGKSGDKDEVLQSGERVADSWFVLGQSWAETDRLWERRVWLYGQNSGRRAMVLDFSFGTRNFELGFVVGSTVSATLAFFPGALPLRALVAGPLETGDHAASPPAANTAEALAWIADAVGASPWAAPLPFLAADVVPIVDAAGCSLRTDTGGRLPLAVSDSDGWQLLALGGGTPVTMFGEWNGERLRPLSCWRPALAWTEGVPA